MGAGLLPGSTGSSWEKMRRIERPGQDSSIRHRTKKAGMQSEQKQAELLLQSRLARPKGFAARTIAARTTNMKAARESGRDWRKPRGHQSGLCCPEATGWADTSPLSFQLQPCMSCSWQADCIPPTERKAVRMSAMHAASPPLPPRAAFRSLTERTFSAEKILCRSIESMML